MNADRPVHFTAPGLDRRAEARLRADWLEEARHDAGTRYLLMRDTALLVFAGQEGSAVALLDGADPRVRAVQDPGRHVLLGWYREQRCVLVDLPADVATDHAERFAELRPLASELPAGDAGLAAYARALQLWRRSHRFCARCGGPLVSARAGHVLRCEACGQQGFPRIDPAIITLVHDGARALLGRQASWPAGRYSTIAGFVEPGESLEQAVCREVHEETGVKTEAVQYHSSQPWPFPASLMLGFMARARFAPPVLHDGELEDARWFTREELRGGGVLLPPPEAISRRLIDDWVWERPGLQAQP